MSETKRRGFAKCLMLLAASATIAASPVTTTAAAEMTTVNIAHARATLLRLPFYIAVVNKEFEKEGIKLEIIDTRSGSDAMKLLAAGRVQLSTGQLVDAVNLNKQGINVQGFWMLTNRFQNSIIVRSAVADKIKSLKDVKNRTFGITRIGSGTWQFAVYMAQQAGLTKADLNFIPVGAGAQVVASVRAGRVDVMSYADPENYLLVAAGDAKFLVDMADLKTHRKLVGDTYLNNQLMATSEYMKSSPKVLQGVANAMQRALNWVNAHNSDEVAMKLMEFDGFKRVNPELFKASVKRAMVSVPKTGTITEEAFNNAMKFPVAIGVIKQALPYGQLVNTSFANKAASSLLKK